MIDLDRTSLTQPNQYLFVLFRMPRVVDEIPSQLQFKVEDGVNKINEMCHDLDSVNLQEVALEQFLELSKEELVKRYANLDFATRRALRTNERLAALEMEVEYQYGTLDITVEESAVILSCDRTVMDIPHSEMEKEFELLGKNTHFNEVIYQSNADDRRALQATKFLQTKKITLVDPNLDDQELQALVQHKEEIIVKQSAVSDYAWIYEKMRDRQLEAKFVRIESFDVDSRYNFLIGLGHFDRDDNKFYATNPNQEVTNDDDIVSIVEGRLQIDVCGNKREGEDGYDSDADGPVYELASFGFISFEVLEETEESK